jgi:hypothetical protein
MNCKDLAVIQIDIKSGRYYIDKFNDQWHYYIRFGDDSQVCINAKTNEWMKNLLEKKSEDTYRLLSV